jgi:hypothetical protein
VCSLCWLYAIWAQEAPAVSLAACQAPGTAQQVPPAKATVVPDYVADSGFVLVDQVGGIQRNPEFPPEPSYVPFKFR